MQTVLEPTSEGKLTLSKDFAEKLPGMIRDVEQEFRRQRSYSSGVDAPTQSLLRAGHHVLSALQALTVG